MDTIKLRQVDMIDKEVMDAFLQQIEDGSIKVFKSEVIVYASQKMVDIGWLDEEASKLEYTIITVDTIRNRPYYYKTNMDGTFYLND